MSLPRKAREGPNAVEARIQRGLGPLVAALADPDEPRRHAAAEKLLQVCIPAVLDLLADRLVNLLGGAGPARRQALASLVQLGQRALPTLTWRFTRTRSSGLQQGMVEALRGIARRLGPGQRFDLMTELLILPRFTAADSVRQGSRRW
jgi:hypothetical protein